MTAFNESRISEYQRMYTGCIIKAIKYPAIDSMIDQLLSNKKRYKAVSVQSNIPWYFIAITHHLEGSQNFKTHLHNGDPLTQRTKHIPKNRPLKGNPPFTWEESALDALTLQGLCKWTNWTLAGLLYKFEAYNGFGYRKAGINIPSPYLWSFSNHYTKGKFVADGKYSDSKVSAQCGAAVLLRRMEERQLISIPNLNKTEEIKQQCEMVKYDPFADNPAVRKLQSLLNAAGYPLRIDGKAGILTSNVCKQVTGKYLQRDPRRKE